MMGVEPTCKELCVRSFGLLDARGGPRVENLWFHDRRLHEVTALIAGAFPRLPVLDLHQQLVLGTHPRHVALPILRQAKQIMFQRTFSEIWS